MSTRRPIHDLLPWYVAGTLDPALSDEFREHLDGCEDCRREQAMLEELKGELKLHGRAFLEDHPNATRIVASARGELGDDEAARVRSHLALCASCAEEAGWAAGEGAYEGAAPRARRPVATRARWPWLAAAAAVLLVALIPVTNSLRTTGLATGVVDVHHVRGAERSSGTSNVVTLGADRTAVLLTFLIDLPHSDFPVTLVVANEDGRVIHTHAGIEPESLQNGWVHFVCTRGDCPEGAYTATVARPGETEPLLSFGFSIVEP